MACQASAVHGGACLPPSWPIALALQLGSNVLDAEPLAQPPLSRGEGGSATARGARRDAMNNVAGAARGTRYGAGIHAATGWMDAVHIFMWM